MNSVLYYSVLNYIPSVVRGEKINVGLAVHFPSGRYSRFFKTTNMRRVRSFDDEYNGDFFNMVMESLRYDLDYGELSNVSSLDLKYDDEEKRFRDITEKSFLENRVSYLSNEFRFSPIETTLISERDLLKEIDRLKDMYMYYDKPKTEREKERITKQKIHSLMAKQLASYNLAKLKREPKFTDKLGVKFSFDYEINNNTLLQALTFDYKELSVLSRELKVLLYDLNAISPKISKIFLIRNDNLEKRDNIEILDRFEKEIHSLENKNKNKILVFPLSELRENIYKEVQ